MYISSGLAALALDVLLLGAAAGYVTYRRPAVSQPVLVALGVMAVAVAVAGVAIGS
ncbi:hypothetical protein [Streptomyces spirodelae]|uniref:Sensor histidine kinase n=1 Tax=Streptomyces spirodelae TaxID=2812904 RepID=A0ABS3X1E3_9ACTN|nr:hypothetical protein [Streptomyces spirodelae]MBO8189199.1 hypothetical protein [Streptomyces spirodelae]